MQFSKLFTQILAQTVMNSSKQSLLLSKPTLKQKAANAYLLLSQYFSPYSFHRHFISSPQAKNLICRHKKVLITGGTVGIGKETCKILAENGCSDITILARNEENARQTIYEMKIAIKNYIKEKNLTEPPNINFKFNRLDLGSISDCKNTATLLAQESKNYDVLIANAGYWPRKLQYTKDGFESGFATCHLGHFALFCTYLNELKNLNKNLPDRMVILSSTAHLRHLKLNFQDLNFKNGRKFDYIEAYSQSKLANMLFAKKLAKILQNSTYKNASTCKTYSVHPGVVQTLLFEELEVFKVLPDSLLSLLLRNSRDGAQTTLFCGFSSDPEAQNLSGKYYANCRESENHVNIAGNDSLQMDKLWEVSENMCDLQLNL